MSRNVGGKAVPLDQSSAALACSSVVSHTRAAAAPSRRRVLGIASCDGANDADAGTSTDEARARGVAWKARTGTREAKGERVMEGERRELGERLSAMHGAARRGAGPIRGGAVRRTATDAGRVQRMAAGGPQGGEWRKAALRSSWWPDARASGASRDSALPTA